MVKVVKNVTKDKSSKQISTNSCHKNVQHFQSEIFCVFVEQLYIVRMQCSSTEQLQLTDGENSPF